MGLTAMSNRENTALATIRIGRSYEEAASLTGLTVQAVTDAWLGQGTDEAPARDPVIEALAVLVNSHAERIVAMQSEIDQLTGTAPH